MHLADGVVANPWMLAGLNLAGAGSLALALRSAKGAKPDTIARAGALSAFVLVAQAINVPATAGASAHAVGAALLTLILGPAQAIVAMAAVVVTQALIFGDGGISVLGINLINIGVIPVLVVHAAGRCCGRSLRGRAAAAAIGTPLGNLFGASSLATLLVAGAGAPASWTFGILVGVQALSGCVEGALTALAVLHLGRRAGAWLAPRAEESSTRSGRTPSFRPGLGWAAVALGVALALVPLASDAPDALERVLQQLEAER